MTGAADDDPSGIATYSEAGTQFGYGLLWTVFLTTPFMIAIQPVSASIGRVTGKGLAANITALAPRWIVFGLVALLVGANTFNIAAEPPRPSSGSASGSTASIRSTCWCGAPCSTA